MNKDEVEDQVLKKINLILAEFECYEKPLVNSNGDIIIKNKIVKAPNKEKLILTNIFKEMIKNDVKKNRV